MTVTDPTTSSVTTLAELPRPSTGSLRGWIDVWRRPERACVELAEVGDRLVMDVPLLPTMFWTSRPDDIRAIFGDRTRTLSFGAGLRRLAPHEAIFGENIMEWWASPDHTVVRRKVAPAFMGKALAGYEDAIESVARQVVRQLPMNEPVRAHQHMRTLAREVIMSVVFGVTDPDRRARLASLLDDLDDLVGSRGFASRYAASMLARGHWLPFGALDRVVAEIDQITYDEIAARRAGAEDGERRDCLAIFLRIQADDPGGPMDDEMIAGFQRLLLVAGLDTTAATMSWILERLAHTPQVLEELERSLAAGEDDYLDAVITETLRLRPTIPFTVRSVTEDIMVNDVYLPAGSMIFMYIHGVHRRADLYEAPEEFRPERFLGVTPDPTHWLPFGGGVNRCLGGHMAMFEARVLIRTILSEVSLIPDRSPAEDLRHDTILLVPRSGAQVQFTGRSAPQARAS